jgi:hypothetical protein
MVGLGLNGSNGQEFLALSFFVCKDGLIANHPPAALERIDIQR